MQNIFTMTLSDSFMISPRVKHFILKAENIPAFHWIPGQFITLHFSKDEKTLKRSYSLANAPSDNNTLEFAAGYVEKGPGTEFLFNLKPGDTLQVSGPYGRLILKENTPKRYILVATSTGITPYRAMLPELTRLLENNPEFSVVIIEGVQHREDILYRDAFMELVHNFPSKAQFKACLSKIDPEHLEEHEHAGYVQTLFSGLQLQPENDMVYLCGNPTMIDEAYQYLQQQQFSVQQIIREKYISR